MFYNPLAFLRARPVERTVMGLLALSFLPLVTSVAIAGGMIQSAARDGALIGHAGEVRMVAHIILTDTINAETGQHGYLLTGERDCLDVANQSIARLPGEFERLRRQVAADGQQAARVDALKTEVDAEVADLRRGLALYDAGRPREAVDFVRSGVGREEMGRVRAIVAAFDDEEASRLTRRRKSTDVVFEHTLAINLVSAVLIVAVGFISVALVRRYIDELHASRAEVDRINRGLEKTVAERTSELTVANEEIRRARDRAEALLREVNHRVANSLQIASSFVQLQARGVTDEAAKSALKETHARIQAVGQVHRRLYTSADVTSVDLKDYLTALADELQHSLGPSHGSISIRVEAEPLRAPTDRAVSLGVITAELVTNAAKYAYLEGQGGEVRVRLATDGDARGVLTVEDDGRGMGGGPPKGTGLGGEIIAAMASTLGSKVEYDLTRGQGVRARLEFALR